MRTTKVRRIGNSLGVILPAEVLSQLRADEGSELFLTQTSSGITLTSLSPADRDALDAARIIMDENFEVLRRLAQ